jgi:hypothetical protein
LPSAIRGFSSIRNEHARILVNITYSSPDTGRGHVKDDLRAKIYSKIDELPTLPIVLPKLLRLMENNTSNASDIADTISRDPALTSKILKVAN